MTLRPLATDIKTMNCACMSVGKPGYGCVLTSTLLKASPPATVRPLSSTLILAPASFSLSMQASRCAGSQPRSVTCPRVRAAATMKVPASIRSGMTVNVVGCKASIPWIVTIEVPAPSIRAPIPVRTSASATISGSRAAFLRTVVPSARTAVIMRFSVPVTVGISK